MTKQLDLFVDSKDIPLVSPLQPHQEQVKISTQTLLENHNYIFQEWNYKSYKIALENGKISKVYFSYGKYKFVVYLDEYSIVSKDVPIHHYYEWELDQRETNISTLSVQNIQIKGIQKKDPVWYGVFKTYVNYFRFTGIDFRDLRNFLEALILDYAHN